MSPMYSRKLTEAKSTVALNPSETFLFSVSWSLFGRVCVGPMAIDACRGHWCCGPSGKVGAVFVLGRWQSTPAVATGAAVLQAK